MPLTIGFRERAQNGSAFRRGLLQETIELMLSGDVKTGQRVIHNTSLQQSVFTSRRSGPTLRCIPFRFMNSEQALPNESQFSRRKAKRTLLKQRWPSKQERGLTLD